MSLLRPRLKSRVFCLLPKFLPVIAVMHQDNFLPQPLWQCAEFVNRSVHPSGKELTVMKNNLKIKALVVAFEKRQVESRI